MTQLREREYTHEQPDWKVRPATPSDARKVVDYLRAILQDRQSSIADQDEMILDVMTGREHLRRILENPLSCVYVAETENEIVGFLTCECGRRRKIRHTAEIGMSVRDDYRRQGVGSALLEVVETWARETGRIRKITLNVFETNVSALRLYEKYGFEVEGVLKEHINLDGEYLNLVLMAKEIGDGQV